MGEGAGDGGGSGRWEGGATWPLTSATQMLCSESTLYGIHSACKSFPPEMSGDSPAGDGSELVCDLMPSWYGAVCH